MQRIWADWALTPTGWQRGLCVSIDDTGVIAVLNPCAECPAGALRVGTLLPAMANLHSHAFQRAMAGLTERRGTGDDSFWSWRQWMYRFVGALGPADIEAIAAMVQMEMMEAGYASVGEFHYLHHAEGGVHYANIAETSERIVAAAESSGIGLTLLPVLYQQGGCDGRPLAGGQRRFGNQLDEFLRLKEGAESAVRLLGSDCRCGVALHSLRAVSRDAIGYFDALKSEQPLHIHIAEQRAEVEEVSAALGARPVQWLLDNADVDDRWCLVHATHMDSTETRSLAASGAVAGLCPITEANLGDGIFNGVDYKQAHGRFGVGSDSNVRIALAEELRMYEYSQRLQRQQRTLLAYPEGSNGRYLYTHAAAGGAQALNRNSARIEVGATADLLALRQDSNALIEREGDSVIDSWLFGADDRMVEHLWSAGRHMVQSGRHIRRYQIKRKFREVMRGLSEQ